MFVARRVAVGGALVALLTAASPSEPPVSDAALRLATDDVLPAIVQVVQEVHGSIHDDRDGSDHGPYDATFVGTGFFVAQDGYIVTAAHVADPTSAELSDELVGPYIDELYGCDPDTSSDGCAGIEAQHHDDIAPHVTAQAASTDVSVLLQSMSVDDNGLPARLVAASQSTAKDVAVIKVAVTAAPVAIIATDAGSSGTPMTVVGYPVPPNGAAENLVPTVTTGKILDTLPPDPTASVAPDATLVETDAVTKEGDSGGPGVGPGGAVEGIVSFGVSDTDNFLISASDVAALLRTTPAHNVLGATDTAWRNGLVAEASGDTATAVSDFRACTARAPMAVQCTDHADADAGISTRPVPGAVRAVALTVIVLLVAALAAAMVVFVRRRRRAATTGAGPPWPPPPPPPPAS